METPVPSQSTAVQQSQDTHEPVASTSALPLDADTPRLQTRKRSASTLHSDDLQLASSTSPTPSCSHTPAEADAGAERAVAALQRARRTAARGGLARRTGHRLRRVRGTDSTGEDLVWMSRSVSEGSLKEARQEQQVEEGPLAHGHPMKRARKGTAAFEGVTGASVAAAGCESRSRQGVAPPSLDLGDASTASTSSVRNARPPTSTIHQFARIFSPYTHPSSSSSSAASTFPPSPNTFTSSHDSHAGPQRIRPTHQRRRATSLPPPTRQPQQAAHRHPSSPLAHRPSPIPDNRRKEKIYEARRASIAHDASTLSQGDLINYHASHALQLGGKRIHPVPTALTPPITRSTLRELDLSEILRNPQLRHDSVFDPNLMFRPNYDGERGDRKRDLASQYWTAVSREITFGCRCTTYSAGALLPCLCLGLSSSLAARLPSRIPPLIHELQSILLSLLPAPTSATAAPAATASREQVMETLDPDFLTQQLERGVLDVASLARFLGATLKLHCAPMRDGLVDEMVQACEGEGVTRGLRMSFEILELMKLDVANHQLRSLRPYLVQTAMDFELRFFQDFVSRREGSNTLAFERTRKWFLGAAAAQSSPASADPRSLSLSFTVDIVQSAVCSGVLDLVFHPSTFATSPSSTASAQLPETFQLDSYRLASFHSDATDLTVVYLLLSLFQQLCYPARASEAEVDEMRRDIWAIMAGANSAGEKVQMGGSAAAAGQVAGGGMAKLECASWREGMKDVGLQIASRATRIKAGLPSFSTTSLPLIPSASTLALVDSYFSSHLRASSKVFQLLQARLQSTLSVILAEELADEANAQWWTSNVASPACSGSASMMSSGGRRGGCSVRSTPLVADAGSMAAAVGGGGGAKGRKRSLGEGECGDEEGSSSDEEGEKRARTTKTALTSRTRAAAEPSVTQSNAVSSPSHIDATLARNGLTSLSTEVRLLGERVGRVTSFHLAVYKEYYRSLLSPSTL